jgi:hypothetical protein
VHLARLRATGLHQQSVVIEKERDGWHQLWEQEQVRQALLQDAVQQTVTAAREDLSRRLSRAQDANGV